ncbi:MAG: alpha/beta hydrolase fold domain-containing protein [Burkholderiales bacterium]|nr:alpha/beta hydrolase fold domain-containing protein [Burkholderiales bacterium]
MHQLGRKMLNQVTWQKPTPPPNLACRYFTHSTETLLWAAKNEKSRHRFNYADMKRANGNKQMKDVWTFTAPKPEEKTLGKHPTQKPVALLERIILSSTSPDDFVLDPFMGSGTTALVCALLARDAGLPLALQLLITPGTTAHADTGSHTLFANGFLLDAAAIAWFFDHYIDRHHRSDWRFAPLLAPEMDGVAPACLLLAECDPLVDEGLAYADRLRLAGVPVELELYRGLTHDFIKMGRILKEAGQAQQVAADALRKAWTP